MNVKKIVYLSLFSAVFLTGCYRVDLREDAVVTAGGECYGAGCAKRTAAASAPSVAVEREVIDSGYVDYTEVAADYKAYGERTPLDRRVGTSGVASNLSSAVPPTIEEEVFEYEEKVSENNLDTALAQEMQDADNMMAEEALDELAMEDAVEDWLAEEGVTLKDLLTEWSDKAGWRLIWKTNRNYTLTAGAMFRARFADAASALIRAFARARPAPVATFYKGNRVLVIETMEDENAYE